MHLVCKSVITRRKNSRTPETALVDNQWKLDLKDALSDKEAMQCARLWMKISLAERDVAAPDEFSWPCDLLGQYTVQNH
jgi:hypothetical protein